jgi:hypothetical protein
MPLAATRTEYATINGVPVPSQIVDCTSLLELWHGADRRGRDRVIPGAAGVRRKRRRRTVTIRSLPLLINGRSDSDGIAVAAADQRAELAANVAYLRAQWLDPLDSGDGTVPVELHLPGGSVVAGDAHCLALDLGTYHPTEVRAVLTLSLPDGELS